MLGLGCRQDGGRGWVRRVASQKLGFLFNFCIIVLKIIKLHMFLIWDENQQIYTPLGILPTHSSQRINVGLVPGGQAILTVKSSLPWQACL